MVIFTVKLFSLSLQMDRLAKKNFKWANPGLFYHLFSAFSNKHYFLHQIYVKNVNLVYSAGIRTHNLRNISLLP